MVERCINNKKFLLKYDSKKIYFLRRSNKLMPHKKRNIKYRKLPKPTKYIFVKK